MNDRRSKSSSSKTELDNIALIEKWFNQVYNEQKTEIIDELLSPDYIFHYEHGTISGAKRWREVFYDPYTKAIPDIHVEINDVIASGDVVSLRWEANGTFTHELLGMPPSGKNISLFGMSWIKVLDGKIIETWNSWNMSYFLNKLLWELNKSQKLLAEMGKICKVGGWEFDIDTGEQKWTEEVHHILETSLDYVPNLKEGITFYSDSSKPVIAAALQRAIEHGEPYDLELEIITAKGNLRDVHAIGMADLEHRKVYGTFQDITERKHAETELLKVEKLKSVGTLAGGIAHDFNNILTGLYGNVSLAKLKLSTEQPGYHYLEAAEEAMHRAALLTNRLLIFAKGGDPVKTSLNLCSLVEDVVSFSLSGSNVKPVITSAANLWQVNGDHGLLEVVFANLATNAKEAMSDGGLLTITIENAEIADNSDHGFKEGKYLQITITDEGMGIDPKLLGKIFDPYFTTKPYGSGLGLATAHSIINKHDGHIRVTTQLDKGTTFTIYLPAASVEEIPLEQSKPASMPQGKKVKILVMDDEVMIRNIIIEMLGELGFEVETAAEGQRAIDMYRQAKDISNPFDVVILDLTVPGGMGGQDAAKGILKIDPQARLIVSSGYANDPVMANYSLYGFKGVAQKPYSFGKLSKILTQVLKSG